MGAPDSKPSGHTVEKIGGTSIADTEAIVKNVLIGDRQPADCYDRIFVISAYAGMTDLLLEHKKTGREGVYGHFAGTESTWSWSEALSRVGNEMHRINAEVLSDPADCRVADAFVRERIEGARSCLLDLHRLCSYGHFRLDEHLMTVREMLSALGEAHSAYNTVLLLKKRGVNAVFVDLTGWRDDAKPALDERIKDALSELDLTQELPIVTGYAHCEEGLIGRFGRGYSEVTFSRIAVLTGAREAIIHKEFHLSSADPKIAGENRVRTIGRTNYDVADQLSNLGMEAVHPNAAKGLRQAEIPLRIMNAFDPRNGGTVFCGDYTSKTPRAEIVTGLREVYALEFFEQDMVGVKGYDAGILQVLKRHNARVVTKSSNANTITHYLAGSRKAVKRVIKDLEEIYPASEIALRRVAIISAIGSDLRFKGLTATAIGGLADAGVEVLGVHQLMRNVDILFIVDTDDYERGIMALHKTLIERVPPQVKARSSARHAA